MIKLLPQHIPYPLVVLVFLLMPAYNANANELTLAVANSTCNAIKKVGDLYQQQNENLSLKYICKSSGRLAKGLNGNSIEADIYISANKKWMDYMVAEELVSSDQVMNAWGNELVVATPLNSNITNFSWEDLASEKVEIILNTPNLECPEESLILQALDLYVTSNIDFIDAYHACFLRRKGHRRIMTFDKKHFGRVEWLEIVEP